MKLYRVMCRDEWDDLNATGEFRFAAGQLEGKWFALSMVDALVWGRRFPGAAAAYHHVIEIDIDPTTLANHVRVFNLDGIGDAYFFTLDALNGVKFRLVNPPTGK